METRNFDWVGPTPLVPRTGLEGAHAQTLWAYLVQKAPPVVFRREWMRTPDEDEYALDWADSTPGSPLVIVHHGFEGSSRAPYVRRLAHVLNREGWGVVAINARGCGGRDNRLPQAYHGAWTADIEQTVSTLASRFPERPLFLVGYSLGGSQMGNYLGRMAGDVPAGVKGAFLVSTPVSLARAIGALNRGFNKVYSAKFLNTLRPKILKKIWRHPEVREAGLRALLSRSVEQFDHSWTAPVHGFSGGDLYYRDASCERWLSSIQVPTVLLHAQDDPLVPWEAVTGDWEGEASRVTLVSSPRGGHVGFVDGEERNWLEHCILSGLQQCRSFSMEGRT